MSQASTSFPADYFATAYGRTGIDLKTHLESLIDGHTSLSYTPGVWEAHKDLYEDPEDSNNIILFYSGASIDKSLQDSGSSGDYWNREHIWPNSYGLDGSRPRYTDIFNLVPAYKGVNSARGNKYYDITANTDPAHPYAPDCRTDSNSWEPADPQKGWAARALFYMATRYSDLSMVNVSQSATLSTSDNKMAQLDVALDWNRRFLPTTKERAVNDRIYDVYQFNRNPYIDFPEFVDAIWVGHPSWGDWRLTHFTLNELLDDQLSGDAADPDGDGLSNLLEMALYSDPRTTNALPIEGEFDVQSEIVTLYVLQASNFNDLNLNVRLEASTDNSQWNEILLEGTAELSGNNPYQYKVTLERAASAQQREYYRLAVWRPDSQDIQYSPVLEIDLSTINSSPVLTTSGSVSHSPPYTGDEELYVGWTATGSMLLQHGQTVSVAGLHVGRSGYGTLDIESGSTFTVAGTTWIGRYIASNPGGVLTVTGHGSSFSNGGGMRLGNSMNGIINVLDGGLVSVTGTININSSSEIVLSSGGKLVAGALNNYNDHDNYHRRCLYSVDLHETYLTDYGITSESLELDDPLDGFSDLTITNNSGLTLVAGQEFKLFSVGTLVDGSPFPEFPEGAIVYQEGDIYLRISYLGGDGNDIVLNAVQSYESSALTSTVSATSTSLLADGSSTTVITIQLIDALGNTLFASDSNSTFSFDALATGQGALSNILDNNDGTLSATYTAGTLAGTVSIVPQIDGVDFSNPLTINLVPGAADPSTSSFVIGDTSITADGSSTTSILIELKDAFGNSLVSGGDVVTINVPSQGSIGALTDNGDGTYSAIYTSGTVAGNIDIVANVNGAPLTTSASLELVHGTATQLTITTQPEGGPSGTLLTTQPVIAIRDAQGNLVTTGAGASLPVIVSILSGGGGTLGGTTTVNAVNGVATFEDLTLAGTVGEDYIFRFSSDNLATADTDVVNVSHGTATDLKITTQPVGGASGTALTTQPVVTIVDAEGNLVTTDRTLGGPVIVSILSGEGGTLSGTTVVDAVNGVATFTDLTLAGIVDEDYVLRFQSPGLTQAETDAVNVIHGTATQLTITTQPVGGPSGTLLTTQPVIAIRDAQGNLVTTGAGASLPVIVSILSGGGGTLGGTTTVNAVNGVATFTDLTLAGTVGEDYIFRFSSDNLATADTDVVNVSHGVATDLKITTQPVGGASGTALTTQPVVTIVDAEGNLVTTDRTLGGPVIVSILSGEGGTLSGTTVVDAVNGVATFTDLTLAGIVDEDYVLRFQSPGLTKAETDAVNVIHGTATQLTISTQPVGGPSGTLLTTQPVIAVRDAQGNLVTTGAGASLPVIVSILSGGGGTLGGMTRVNAENGVATFEDLTLAGTVDQAYGVRFTSGDLSPVDSSVINISHGAATQLSITTHPLGGASGTALTTQPVIAIRDAQGNLVTTGAGAIAPVTVGIESGVGGTLGGTATVNAVNGVATFTDLTLAGTVDEDYVLRFTSGDFGIVDLNAVTVSHGLATQLSITTQPVGGASGTLLTTQPVIAIRDAQGNLVTTGAGAIAQVTVGIESGVGGTLGGTVPVNAVNGIATFTDLTLAGTVDEDYVLRFTSGDFGIVDSNAMTVSHGSATQLTISTQPVGGASGTLLTTQPVIAIRDAQGNLVTTGAGAIAQVTVGIESGVGGTLGGTATVNAVSGIATFTDLTLAGTVDEDYVLRLNSPGLTQVDSVVVKVTPGFASLATTLVTTSPELIVADGVSESTIMVQLKDAEGNNTSLLAEGASVTITVNGGNLLDTLTNLGNGRYRQQFRSSTVSQTVTVEAFIGDMRIIDTATIEMEPGALSIGPSGSTLQLLASTVVANGSDIATVQVQLRDVYGNAIRQSGVGIQFSTTHGALNTSIAQTNSDGMAAVTLSTTVAGMAQISATIVGTGAVANPSVVEVDFVPGPPSRFIVDGFAANHFSNLPFDVRVTLVDAFNNPVRCTEESVVTVGAYGGEVSGFMRTVGIPLADVAPHIVLPVGASSGTFESVVFTGSSDPTKSRDIFITALGTGGTADAISGTSEGVTMRAVSMEMTVSESQLTANDQDTADVSIRLGTASGLPIQGQMITLVTDLGAFGDSVMESVPELVLVTDVNGEVATQFHASTVAGLSTIQAYCPGDCVETATIDLKPGPAAKLALTDLPAVGTSSLVLETQPTIEVVDAFGNRITTDNSTIVYASIPSTRSVRLRGDTDLRVVNGVAAFSGLSLEGFSGIDFTIHFRAVPLLDTIDSETLSISPIILVNDGLSATAEPFTVNFGNASSFQSFSIRGLSLGGAITATAPEGFEVSLNMFQFSDSVEFTAPAGTVDANLYLRFVGSADTSIVYDGVSVALTSPGAITRHIFTAASGNTVIGEDQYIYDFLESVVKLPDSEPYLLEAKASSGLPISYASSNPSVATVSGAILTIQGPGTTTITATQPGNGAFNAAPPLQQTLKVLSQLDLWRAENFGSYDATGAAMNSADADADGLPNILEFAFGTDPDVPGRGRLSGLQDGLPISGEPAIVRKTGTQGMMARYSRYADTANSGIEYFPQFSADLQVWETRVLGQESLGTSGNYELMEVPFPSTLSTGEPPRFFRVKVEVKP